MGYCTASDVASLARYRAIGVGAGQPTLTDLTTYINMSAGEIDAILVNKGYTVPVNIASWPEAGALLNKFNAQGALALLEEASPQSVNLDRVQAAWEAAKKMLSDANTVLNADMDVQRSEPRGPWVTMQPSGRVYDPTFNQVGGDGISRDQGNPRDPYFSRAQRF